MREGRFSSAVSEIAQRYSESVSFDRRLYRHDIAGSIAHASALASAGILAADEFEMIARGLREIENEIAADKFVWDQSLEDGHMNIEAALTKRIGPAGAKLHTGRSRNDQIALDLRLYVREEIDEIITRLRALQIALLLLAQKHYQVLMPGYTHLQRAQPIYFAHYLLAQLEALERDHERLRDARRRADVMPLGSGALAGSTIALDREGIAKALGFQRVTQNSVDAVSDRDFVADFLYSLAMIGIHLSRFSEDLILWSTSEFGFIEFSDAFATGSSLMPQKKNPDMPELTRGKSGRLIGNLVTLLAMLKGLPSAYNRDLQEDKEVLFDSVDTVRSALELFSTMLPELTINRERMNHWRMIRNCWRPIWLSISSAKVSRSARRTRLSENSLPAANSSMLFRIMSFARPRTRSRRMCAKSLTSAKHCSAAPPLGRLHRRTSSARSRAGANCSNPNNSLFARRRFYSRSGDA